MVYFFKLTEEEIMKKTVSFFLAFIMIFTLCACNNAPLETPVPTPAPRIDTDTEEFSYSNLKE